MKRNRILYWIAGVALVLGILGLVDLLYFQPQSNSDLRVAVAPYQDMAMLMVYSHLGLEEKYDLDIEVITLPWEDIQASLASAGETVDIGFGSLIEYLTKWEQISKGSKDPLVFVHPTYIFKGGGFVTFSDNVPTLDDYAGGEQGLAGIPRDKAVQFLSLRIGAQTNSMWDMLVYQLADTHEVPISNVKVIDVPASDALLAAEAGSLDVAGAGVTQRNEALERGGRVVFTMDKFGFADITGIICRQSVLEEKRSEIERFLLLWFDCVEFVYEDIDRNSQLPIAYLDKTSSTNYTVESYKRALQVEILPTSLAEARRLAVGVEATYSISLLQDAISSFLLHRGVVSDTPPTIIPINVSAK